MAIETERKFLLASDGWRAGAGDGVRMVQGYFSGFGSPEEPAPTVRVRIAGARGFLTVKGRPSGWSRSEFEYEIPLADAEAMLRSSAGRGSSKSGVTGFRPVTVWSGRSTSISAATRDFSPQKSNCRIRRVLFSAPTGSARRFPAIRATPMAL